MNWLRTREIVRKEFIQVFREPRMRFVLIMPPLIETIIFGFAVNLDVTNARLAWLDRDGTPASIALRSTFEASNAFSIVAEPETDDEVTRLLDRGEVAAVISVLPGFEKAVSRGDTAPVQILIDGSNSNTASVISSYARQTVALYGQSLQEAQQASMQLARTQGRGDPMLMTFPGVDAQSRVWYNPSLESRNYFIPGVIANILALVTLMLTAMAIVREKEIGTMEQLMVTPIQPFEMILGKTLPFALVGLFDVIAMTAIARLIFDVRLAGSLSLLLFCSVLYFLTTLGGGLFVSTLVRTQQQAMLSTLFVFLPLFLLSGFAFPISSMPELVQHLTLLNPVRYYMEIVRALFLKGVGLEVIWMQVVALAVIGCVALVASALRFTKRMD